MNKNNFPIYLSLATIFGIFIGFFMNEGGQGFSLKSNTKNEAKIRRLMEYIDQNYVDTINTNSLLDGAITQVIRKLDPHSAYIPKEELQEAQDRMQGKFVGVGIQFRMINDSLDFGFQLQDDIFSGYIINFGVQFEVNYDRRFNSTDVKLETINVIKEFFKLLL